MWLGGDVADERRGIGVEGFMGDVALLEATFLAQILPFAAADVADWAEVTGRLSLLPPPSPASSDSLSSDPPLSLSRISDALNLREALGDAGGGRRLQTCTWISSQSRRKRRRLPVMTVTLGSFMNDAQYN